MKYVKEYISDGNLLHRNLKHTQWTERSEIGSPIEKIRDSCKFFLVRTYEKCYHMKYLKEYASNGISTIEI